MIKYWITGVLKETGVGGIMSRFTYVAWTGPTTKEMVPFTVKWDPTGESEIKVGIGRNPYGYSNRRWAGLALARLTMRGEGFMPLLHVSELQVRVIEYRSDGRLFMLTRRL